MQSLPIRAPVARVFGACRCQGLHSYRDARRRSIQCRAPVSTMRRRVVVSVVSRALCTSSVTRGELGVHACVTAMLDQQRALLTALDDPQYTFHSPLLGGTIGGHTRHALDHLRKPLESWHARDATIRYDQRARQTDVERDRHAALVQIEGIRRQLAAVDSTEALMAPIDAAFMLSGDGHEFAFASTLSRELAFGVHHAIHHSALVKVLLRHHFPQVHVPLNYGLAPSTLNFQLHEPTE